MAARGPRLRLGLHTRLFAVESISAHLCSALSVSLPTCFCIYICICHTIFLYLLHLFPWLKISEWWHCLFLYCWWVGNYLVRRKILTFQGSQSSSSQILSTQCVSLFIVLWIIQGLRESWNWIRLDNAYIAVSNYSVHCVIVCGVRPRKLNVKGSGAEHS